jgi:hypothetical protein
MDTWTEVPGRTRRWCRCSPQTSRPRPALQSRRTPVLASRRSRRCGRSGRCAGRCSCLRRTKRQRLSAVKAATGQSTGANVVMGRHKHRARKSNRHRPAKTTQHATYAVAVQRHTHTITFFTFSLVQRPKTTHDLYDDNTNQGRQQHDTKVIQTGLQPASASGRHPGQARPASPPPFCAKDHSACSEARFSVWANGACGHVATLSTFDSTDGCSSP